MMKSKRQTVWLVTMVGLMTVVSVYYVMTDPQQPWALPGDSLEFPVQKNNVPTVEVEAIAPADASKKITEGTNATSDQFFLNKHIEKHQELSKETEKYLSIINDANANSDDMTKAYDAVAKLEAIDDKMTSIEEKLSKNYKDVILLEENDRYKVLVQTNQLASKQAAEIVNIVMNEMHVGPANVMIQYIP